MAASCCNPLQLLFLGTLLLSAAVLCRGDPVLDTDGNAVGVFSAVTLTPQYMIQDAVSGAPLAAWHKSPSACENFVAEARPGVGVEISSTTSQLQQPFVQLGSRYGFTFRMGAVRLCHTDWYIGDVVNTGKISFQPIIAGDVFDSDRKNWFEIRSTETKGVYKLAACPCEFCKISCPELGSFGVNGTTVLGVGGSHYTVRFVKSVPKAVELAEQ